jgi:hypothetical protein
VCGYRAYLRARSRVGGSLTEPNFIDLMLWAVRIFSALSLRTPLHVPTTDLSSVESFPGAFGKPRAGNHAMALHEYPDASGGDGFSVVPQVD